MFIVKVFVYDLIRGEMNIVDLDSAMEYTQNGLGSARECIDFYEIFASRSERANKS